METGIIEGAIALILKHNRGGCHDSGSGIIFQKSP